MAHHELLAKIVTLEARYTDYPTYLALRAVVELHNPDSSGAYLVCVQCQAIYPCLTIQAIEKELI